MTHADTVSGMRDASREPDRRVKSRRRRATGNRSFDDETLADMLLASLWICGSDADIRASLVQLSEDVDRGALHGALSEVSRRVRIALDTTSDIEAAEVVAATERLV